LIWESTSLICTFKKAKGCPSLFKFRDILGLLAPTVAMFIGFLQRQWIFPTHRQHFWISRLQGSYQLSAHFASDWLSAGLPITAHSMLWERAVTAQSDWRNTHKTSSSLRRAKIRFLIFCFSYIYGQLLH